MSRICLRLHQHPISEPFTRPKESHLANLAASAEAGWQPSPDELVANHGKDLCSGRDALLLKAGVNCKTAGQRLSGVLRYCASPVALMRELGMYDGYGEQSPGIHSCSQGPGGSHRMTDDDIVVTMRMMISSSYQ